MPIYEFVCSRCEHFFEALVPRPGAKADCPECGSRRVTQAISRPGGFAVSGSSPSSCPVSGGPAPESCDPGG
ncbi:MAG: FmdB family zinc ribbon protein [Planctomycetota bacterium]|jgi:putative FmdB family regulatory protein